MLNILKVRLGMPVRTTHTKTLDRIFPIDLAASLARNYNNPFGPFYSAGADQFTEALRMILSESFERKHYVALPGRYYLNGVPDYTQLKVLGMQDHPWYPFHIENIGIFPVISPNLDCVEKWREKY